MSALQHYITLTAYPTTHRHIPHKVALLVLSDAGRAAEHVQLSYQARLLLGDMQKESPYHVISRRSNMSRRPVRSIGASEILAAREDIDEGKMLARTMSSIFNSDNPLVVSLNICDLFPLHITQRNTVQKIIRCNVNMIR